MTESRIFRGVERLPSEAELHHWADYVELLCLLSDDGMISPAQIDARIRRGRDLGEATEASTQGSAELDFDTVESVLGLSSADDDVLAFVGAEWDDDLDEAPPPPGVEEIPDSDVRDSFSRRVDDIWLHLKYRQSAFGGGWPFEIVGDARVIKVRNSGRAIASSYIFLLYCSSLRYIQQSPMSKLTKAFELFSHKAFQLAYPGWEVHVFGTTAPVGSRYYGSFWSKVQMLAKDLRCRLLVDEDELHEGESGDNGLDLVAWLPLPDISKGLPMAFGQCTCGASNWKLKQSEASSDRWGEALVLSAPLQNWTFIPFAYHGPRGDWETPHEVSRGILADRLRLLSLLADDADEALGSVTDLLDFSISAECPSAGS